MRTQLCELLEIEYPILQGAWPGLQRLSWLLPFQCRGWVLLGQVICPRTAGTRNPRPRLIRIDPSESMYTTYLPMWMELLKQSSGQNTGNCHRAGNPGNTFPVCGHRCQGYSSSPIGGPGKTTTRLGVDAVIAEGMKPVAILGN